MQYEFEISVRLVVDAANDSDAYDAVHDYFDECSYGAVKVEEFQIDNVSDAE